MAQISTPVDEIDPQEIDATYQARKPLYESLLKEVEHVLHSALDASGVKIHDLDCRVKPLESVLNKCRRDKCADPFSAFSDMVGARVICLFKSDIDRVASAIGSAFDVADTEDKRLVGDAPLGYMSVHFDCTLPSTYRGPRYDHLKDLKFEIQVRTLCMHSWAAMSHYLDYKGEWDVPSELKQALAALSGLFFVADNEFQQFYSARLEAQKRAGRQVATSSGQVVEINLDTTRALLDRVFSDRKPADLEDASELVRELKEAGFADLAAVEKDLRRAREALRAYEQSVSIYDTQRNKKLDKFAALGAARSSLCIANERFRDFIHRDREWGDGSRYSKFFDKLLDD